jgi:threonine/homoserine/homoserine lactone efflux protein
VRAFEALVLFAFVSSVTPGPNNALLWASGLQFGFRATLPQILGTAAGIGVLAVAVAAGLGAVVTGLPEVEFALKLLGSLYLLFLAFQLAGGAALQRAQIARPIRVHEAAAFQFLNPKAWLFALAAVSTFRPTSVPVAIGSAIVIVTMVVVVLPTASIWAAGGTALQRLTARRRAHRAMNGALALLLAASIAFIWM